MPPRSPRTKPDEDEDEGKGRGRKPNPMMQALLEYEVVTSQELAIFEARAQQWKLDTDSFEDWQMDRLMVYIQILDKLAVTPPPGRGSGSLVIQAIKDVREQASAMSAIMAEARQSRKHTLKK